MKHFQDCFMFNLGGFSVISQCTAKCNTLPRSSLGGTPWLEKANSKLNG